MVMVKGEDILIAHYDCYKGKASSPDAIRFVVNLFENITDLTDSINNRSYQPLPSITFVSPSLSTVRSLLRIIAIGLSIIILR